MYFRLEGFLALNVRVPYLCFFSIIFSEPMITIFLRLPERRDLDPNGTFMGTIQTKTVNVCLSIILEFYLRSVVCPTYTSLCTGLKCLPKVSYIIVVDPNSAGSLISNTTFLLRDGNIALYLKTISQNFTEWVSS